MQEDWPDRYVKIEIIGNGSHGKIYKVRDENEHRDVAIKKFRPNDNGISSAVLRELAIYRTLCHPNVVKMYDCLMVKPKSKY
jgi:serine/threonine protein kinase